MPYTGDSYGLPSGTAAVSGELIASDKWNSVTGDLAAAQNDIRPTVAGGTGVASYAELLTAIAAMPLAQMTGVMAMWGGTTAPSGWLECDGTAVSRETYADLFEAIGTTWGSGDGSTTFNLPDMRDEFARGASGTRAVGTSQADEIEAHLHSVNPPSTALAISSGGSHSHTASAAANGSHSHSGTAASGGAHTHSGTTASSGDHDHNIAGNTNGDGDGTVVQMINSNVRAFSDGGFSMDDAGAHTHSFTTGSGGAHTHSLNISTVADHTHSVSVAAGGVHSHTGTVDIAAFNSASTGGAETRPRNKAVMFIIKA